MSNTIKNLEKFVDFCDEMQIATEANIISNEESLIDNLSIVYEHMLKLKYRTENQNNSWYSSIISFQKRFSKIDPSDVAEYFRHLEHVEVKAFQIGLDRVVSTKDAYYTYDMFPSEIPENWNLLNIVSFDFMKNFIMSYVLPNTKNDAIIIINEYSKHKKTLDKMISKYKKYTR